MSEQLEVNRELIRELTNSSAQNTAHMIINLVSELRDRFDWTEEESIAVSNLAIEVYKQCNEETHDSVLMLLRDVAQRKGGQ